MVEGKIETVTVSTFAEQSLSELSYFTSSTGNATRGTSLDNSPTRRMPGITSVHLRGSLYSCGTNRVTPQFSSVRIVDQSPLVAGGQGSLAVRFIGRLVSHLIGDAAKANSNSEA